MTFKRYMKLFSTMFELSAFTFGGGYVIVSLMKQKFVDELGWLDDDEMLNLVAIAQSAPGAVAVNGALLVGYKTGGILGALISIIGTILPPFIIISIISQFYIAFKTNLVVNAFLKGMQPAIAAVIADVVINLGSNVIKQKKTIYIIAMLLAFVTSLFFSVNVMYIIFCCGILGFFYSHLEDKKEKKK
ncbi:MAG: chromate transporter [Sphaerochaetaceae bacterium]|nr:chromate transporter [Sphaerochaetaceae bacterium]